MTAAAMPVAAAPAAAVPTGAHPAEAAATRLVQTGARPGRIGEGAAAVGGVAGAAHEAKEKIGGQGWGCGVG